MKNFFNYLLFLLAFLFPQNVTAHDFEVDGIYYSINGNQATVTYKGTSSSQYLNEYSGSITIPSTVAYNGTTYSVMSIGNEAFYECYSLTNITIPNSVNTIGKRAFYRCDLTSIDIPNSVTNIGDEAFSQCGRLASISIPNSVTRLGVNPFIYCNELESITVASDNPIYDSRNNCNAIIEMVSNTLIAGCQNTIIPNSVTSIGDCAFRGCNLVNFTIPNSVTTIGSRAFQSCYGLNSIIIPNSVISISNYAFGGCISLSSIDIPNSVTSIGEYAFSQCSKLPSVTIPNSVTSIGRSAFSGCESLSSVIIGSSVSSIGQDAFNSCEVLANVTCLPVTPPVINGENCFYPAYLFATLHVPAQSVEAYKTAPYWIRFSNIMGDANEDDFLDDYMKCDTNGDGEVNIADVNKVIDAILSH